MARHNLAGREILLEHKQIGSLVKVSAFDVLSMTEVCIQGHSNSPKEILNKNAIARLEYVLRKKGVIT